MWKVIIPVKVRTKGGASNPKFLTVVVMIPNRIQWEEKETYWSIRLSKEKKYTVLLLVARYLKVGRNQSRLNNRGIKFCHN